MRSDSRGGAVACGSDRLRGRVLTDIADGVKAGACGLHPAVGRHMAGVAEL